MGGLAGKKPGSKRDRSPGWTRAASPLQLQSAFRRRAARAARIAKPIEPSATVEGSGTALIAVPGEPTFRNPEETSRRNRETPPAPCSHNPHTIFIKTIEISCRTWVLFVVLPLLVAPQLPAGIWSCV